MKENWFLFSASRCIIDWYGCWQRRKVVWTHHVFQTEVAWILTQSVTVQHIAVSVMTTITSMTPADDVVCTTRLSYVMRCGCGYLAGARCRLFAYGPADATAISKPHHVFRHLYPDWFYLSATGLPRLSWERCRWLVNILRWFRCFCSCFLTKF